MSARSDLGWLNRGPIGPDLHGLLDLVLGVLVLASPLALGIGTSEGSVFLAVGGALILLNAAATRWQAVLLPALSARAHLAVDTVLALALLVSPFTYLSDDAGAATVAVVTGAIILAMGLLTRWPGAEGERSPATPVKLVHDGAEIRARSEEHRSRGGPPVEEHQELTDADAPAEWPDPARPDDKGDSSRE